MLPPALSPRSTPPQEKKKAKAQERDRECTFSPRLVASEKRPTAGVPAPEGLGGLPKAPRHDRLYTQASVTRSRLEAEREKLDPECTFKPTMLAKSPTATMRPPHRVFETLYEKVRN